jgi:hypothetical protein
MAKSKAPSKKKEAPKGKSKPVAMPAGTPDNPGPPNDPNDHPVNNLPAPTDPRWAEQLQAMASQQSDSSNS